MRRHTIAIALCAVTCMAATCEFPWLAETEAHREHILNRISYGPTAASRARIEQLGIPAYIEEQLHPETLADPVYDAMTSRWPSLGMNYRTALQNYSGGFEVMMEMTEARVARAIFSERQLEALLLEFWFDHFNVFIPDGLAQWDGPHYEQQAIRPHVLGRFEDMLIAVAESPAMLNYLDADESSRLGMNENYAREVMELHTLGVEGGYTEADIGEVARAFTGWNTDPGATQSASGFLYRASWHDPGQKTVLGTVLNNGGGANGKQDGYAVLRLLANHPSTARFLSRKLATWFFRKAPPEPLVERLAASFLQTGGDLREVTRKLLLSPELRYAAPRTEPKRPLVFVASLARALGAVDNPEFIPSLAWHLGEMGEAPYQARTPKGRPETAAVWAGNGTLIHRFELAWWAAHGYHGYEFTLNETGNASGLFDKLADRLFASPPSAETRAKTIAYWQSLPQPDRLYDGAPQMLGMLAATPEFMKH